MLRSKYRRAEYVRSFCTRCVLLKSDDTVSSDRVHWRRRPSCSLAKIKVQAKVKSTLSQKKEAGRTKSDTTLEKHKALPDRMSTNTSPGGQSTFRSFCPRCVQLKSDDAVSPDRVHWRRRASCSL